MSTPQLQLADFMDLFSGNTTNYGQHIYKYVDNGKEEGKNATITNKLLTMEQYKAHLAGEVGLGIIPIDPKGECKFAAIDIDIYDENLNLYIDAIEANNFPLVPCRSKSGGVHLFLFMQQAVNAKALIDIMNTFVMILGLDLYIKQRLNKIIEIFPKQSRTSEKTIGNWINLPYYKVSEPRQYVIRAGKPLNFDDGLAYMKERRKKLSEVRQFINELTYSDGPPCIQTINLLNIMDKDSGRNNYLFHFGVYLKKKDPDFWEQKLFEVNASIRNPLPKAELEATIINSLRKKDYTYKCLEPPCVNFCRKSLCKTREFGIGKEGGYFSELEYGKLSQIRAYEPYYEWEVKTQGTEAFKLLRFHNEDEIIKQDAFLKLCFRELHILPIKMKQSEWFKLVNQALSEVEIKEIDKEDDTSPIVLFQTIFLEFLLERAAAQTREQILNKRVFLDTTNKCYQFRAADLSEFVFISKNFRYFTPSNLHAVLHDFKVRPIRIRTESGKQLRVYSIAIKDVESLTPSNTEGFKANFEKDGEQF